MVGDTGQERDDGVDDLDKYRQSYVDILIRQKDYGKFEKAIIKAARGNYRRKMEIYLNIIDEYKINMLSSFPAANTFLKTAVLFCHYGYETMELLATRCPNLLLLTLSSETQQTILHLVVARQDPKGTKIILEGLRDVGKNGDILLEQYLHLPLDSKKDPNMAETCYEAELPLSMAAWNCDIQTIDVLLEFGASIGEKNDKQDNVFHSLIKMASKEECKASKTKLSMLSKTFQHLIDRGSSFGGVKLLSKQFISTILEAKNNDGLTPLILAAKNSSQDMFNLLINCAGVYKLLDTVEGISNIYLYDITEVDSAPECNGQSVLEIIMSSSHERPHEYFDFTELCPILQLIRDKWNRYRIWYIIWGVTHLLMMIFYTITSVTSEPASGTVSSSSSPPFLLTNKSTTDESVQSYKIFTDQIPIDIFNILHLVYATVLLMQEVYQIVKRRPELSQFTNPVGDVYYRVLLIFYGASTLAASVLYFLGRHESQIPQCAGLIFGWAFLMFFSRGVKTFSFFTVIMQAAFGDILRFLTVYTVILVPFSAAMTIVFQSTDSTVEFTSFQRSLFSMFQLTIGLLDLDVTKSGVAYPELALVLYITFLCMAYILLLNMVIALLSETCARVSANRQSQWHLQKLGIILFIEARLLKRHRHCCGFTEDVKLFQTKETHSQHSPHTPRGIKQQLLPTLSRDTSLNKAVTVRRRYFRITSLVQSFTNTNKSINTDIDSLNACDEMDSPKFAGHITLGDLEHREKVVNDGRNLHETGNMLEQTLKRDLNVSMGFRIEHDVTTRSRRHKPKSSKYRKNNRILPE